MKSYRKFWIEHRSDVILVLLFISLLLVVPGILRLSTRWTTLWLDGKDDADIATAISGYTAPVIGVFSTILLYKALKAQVNSNRHQLLQHNAQLADFSISDVERKIQSYTVEVEFHNGSETKYGISALQHSLSTLTHELLDNHEGGNFVMDGKWKLIDVINESTKAWSFLKSVELTKESRVYFDRRLANSVGQIYHYCIEIDLLVNKYWAVDGKLKNNRLIILNRACVDFIKSYSQPSSK